MPIVILCDELCEKKAKTVSLFAFEVKDIKLAYVKQNVGIKFSKEGVKTAVVTSVGINIESVKE